MHTYLLSLCILLPLVGVLVAVICPSAIWIRRFALATAGGEVLLCLYLGIHFDVDDWGIQFAERLDWIPELGVAYHLGIDGISLLPFVLTGLLLFVGLLARPAPRGEVAGLLTVASGALGAFAARDLLFFYFCTEAVVLPLLVLVSRADLRPRAGLRMGLYGLAGSAPMLIAVIYLAVAHLQEFGQLSFDLADLQTLDLPLGVQSWLLLALSLGFAVRAPLIPFHAWLSAAQRVVSPGVALVLICAWLQVGAYGILRFGPTLLPEAFVAWRELLAVLAVVVAIYGSLLGLAQDHLRAWISSAMLSQVGWLLFGVCTLHISGLEGSVFLLVGQSLGLGAIFLLAAMLDERGVELSSGLGLGRVAPRFAGWLRFVVFMVLGLPGTVVFVGKFLVLIAAFEVWGGVGLLILVAALLHSVGAFWLVQRIVCGVDGGRSVPEDMRWREAGLVASLLVCALALGLVPGPVLDRVSGSVDQMLLRAQAGGEQMGKE